MMSDDIENNSDVPTETNKLLERKGQKIKINAIHHENTLYARMCGCIMYYWNSDAVAQNLVFCVAFICIIIMALCFIYLITCIASLLVTYITNHYPQFAYYKSVDKTYSINNATHNIDQNYESCYVEDNKEHCRKYSFDENNMCGEIAVSLGLFIFLDICLPIIVSLVGKRVLVGIVFSIVNILFFALFAMLMGCATGDVSIIFYGNVPPNHFKTFVHSCEEADNGYEIMCEHDKVDIMLIGLSGSASILPFDMFLYETHKHIQQMYDEYNTYREKVKKQIRENSNNVELV
jgi:hypothetical protein